MRKLEVIVSWIAASKHKLTSAGFEISSGWLGLADTDVFFILRCAKHFMQGCRYFCSA